MRVFVWAPEFMRPNLQIRCPYCRGIIISSEWSRPRILHGLAQASFYTTRLYTCPRCPGSNETPKTARARNDSRVRKKFSADMPELLALLPQEVLAKRTLLDTGRILYEAPVLDFVRSMSTRTSWSAIAEVLTDMKTASWMKSINSALKISEGTLQLSSAHEEIKLLPGELALSAEWVRNLYVNDAKARSKDLARELEAEIGDDILMLDWTKDAATRSGAKWLFNAMDSRCRVIGFKLTRTSKPHEVKSMLASLAKRGVRPALIYVDDECCGQWRAIASQYWPEASVRLDPLHAMRRLTKTVSSLQHPWHAEFCRSISDAMFEYDADAMSRLMTARARAGLGLNVPRAEMRKYVQRKIPTNPNVVAAQIEEVLDQFAKRRHAEAGPLVTETTSEAWSALKKHVTAGCLCDPPGVQLSTLSGPAESIGGEIFHEVRSRRGSSALEGFHAHQKQWLGTFASHSLEAGALLLADGAAKWNRKRKQNGSRP